MQEKKKRIVFYSATDPTVLIYKIAMLLKKNGYEADLVVMCEKERIDYQFYSEAFDKIIYSNFQFVKSNMKNPFYMFKRIPALMKFLIFLKTIKPYVIIGIAGNNWQLKLVHKYFFKKRPFIYFPYDILSHAYNSKEEALKTTKKFELDAERYCFENAQGIMHKGAPNELESKNDFIHEELKLPPLQLNFMPYCLKEFSVEINKNKLSKKDKQLHLVYIGGFSDEPETKKRLYLFLKETFKQGIHSHFYLKMEHISNDKEKKQIKNLFAPFSGNKLLHVHTKLNPKEIVSEISKYDFGFLISYGLDIPEIKNGVGNKIATYLEAGIPMLYDHRSIFLDKLMKSYGLGFSFNEKNIKDLSKRLKKLNFDEVEKKIIKAREDFDMDKNFIRLEDFIKKVVKNKNKL